MKNDDISHLELVEAYKGSLVLAFAAVHLAAERLMDRAERGDTEARLARDVESLRERTAVLLRHADEALSLMVQMMDGRERDPDSPF